jgi:hypothetical protein
MVDFDELVVFPGIGTDVSLGRAVHRAVWKFGAHVARSRVLSKGISSAMVRKHMTASVAGVNEFRGARDTGRHVKQTVPVADIATIVQDMAPANKPNEAIDSA